MAPNIPGLHYWPGFLLDGEQLRCLQTVDALPWDNAPIARRVQQYGYRYDYTTKTVEPARPMPLFWLGTAPLIRHLLYTRLVDDAPNQLIVNEYLPGQGINPHTDSDCFGDTVVSISLGSACIMEFTKPWRFVPMWLMPGSLLVLTGEARREWRHGIPARHADSGLPRGRRVSLTFRTVLENSHESVTTG